MKLVSIAVCALLITAPVMAKQKDTPPADLTGMYEYLTREPELPRVPEGGPYGETAKTRDIAPQNGDGK